MQENPMPNYYSDDQWDEHLEKGSLGEALQVLNLIKTELSVRPNNEHVGSGMGGNAGELLFLLSHEVTPIISYTDPQRVGWFKNGNEIQVRFSPKKKGQKRTDLKNIRQSLSVFIKQEYPNAMDIGFPILLETIQNLEPVTSDIRLLQQAFQLSVSFAADLKHTLALQQAMGALSAKEEKDLQVAFCREVGLKFEEFEKDVSQLPKMMRKHPVFGPKLTNKSERFSKMEDLLLSETDILNLKTINAFPAYIATLCMRTQIGIETIVQLNLDEYMGPNPMKDLEESDDHD